jgi:phosphoglycolate phosphatase
MITSLRPIPTESIRLLVFDMDGTLVDSRKDLCNSINAMLKQVGCHQLPEAVIASYIGDGAAMLVRRALGDPDDADLVDRALRYFLSYYREHKLDNTHAYSGVLESLHTLATRNEGSRSQRALAVLTNKPVGPARAICDALGMGPYFFQIYGGDSFHVKKPDPQGLEELMKEAQVTPEQTVMVGDSDVDVLTARNAGVWVIGCKFGLSPHTLETAPPDLLVDSAFEWVQALSAEKISR